jgi:serine/threonine protein kinase/tetratricopeptide (TPR) repeat protein
MTGFKGTERYVVLRYLGSGSFGEVYEVFDREQQTKVALKIPHEATAGGLYYFKREFRSLVDLTHPHLAALYELVGNQDQWFFTMELIQGIPFRNYLRCDGIETLYSHASSASPTRRTPSQASSGYRVLPETLLTASVGCAEPPPPMAPPTTPREASPGSPPTDYHAVRVLMRQLAEGLTALHAAGKLHRDLKPSNVLVSEDGHLSILDFGLVVEMSRGKLDDKLATHLIGTPAYMAPEQLEGHRGGEPSDWYSVGVMLYEVLTGHQPYSGTLLDMIRAKVEQDPLPPSVLVPGTPEDLETLCMGLLRRDPQARPSGTEILECLKDCGSLASASEDQRPPTSTSLLIGRDRELATLFETFRSMRDGGSRMIKLHGGSGTGKTHLIKHFIQELQRREPLSVILQGRCYEQESLPFKAIDPLIDDLSRYLSHLTREKVGALVPRNAHALARLFPVLNRIDAFTRVPAPLLDLDDVKTVRRRAVLALRELLGRLRDRSPLVLIVDDLQWGDLDSANLLSELLAAPDPPSLLLVVCYRTEEEASSPVLVELFSKPMGLVTHDLPLLELSPRLAEDLALDLIGSHTPEGEKLAKRIARDSGGNPFFIGELAHHTQSGFTQESLAPENTLYGCIQQRISNLPLETQRVVEILALAGHPLSWDVIKKTSGLEGTKLPPTSLLKAARLVRTRTTKDQPTLEIYHDFVRRAVISNMNGPSRRKGHLRLAETLEACAEGEPETLARHYVLAGESRKASEFTARAADRAVEAFAFKGAADLYRRSIDLRPLSDPETPDLRLRLANALSSAGLGREAAEAYLRVASMLGLTDRQRLERRAAEEFFRSGYFDQGVETLRPLLRGIGMRLPEGGFISRLITGLYSIRLKLRSLDFRPRNTSQIPTQELERLDTCWAAVQGLGTGALVRSMDLQVRHLLLALKVGEPSRVIRALAQQTLLESMHGNRSLVRTQRYQSVSLALAESHNDPKLTGYVYMTAGIAAMLQGRWNVSVNLLERARAIYTEQCVGVTAELHQVNHHLLSALFVQGNFLELEKRHPMLLRDAEERGDLLAEANLKTGYSLFHHLAKDDPASAQKQMLRALQIWSSKEFHSQHWQAMILQGAIHLYTGNAKAAWRILIQQWNRLRASRLMDVQYVRISCHEHRARTALAYARTCSSDSSDRRVALRVAWASIKIIQREKVDYGQATVLKLKGIAAAITGKKREACDWLLKAEIKYEAIQMPLHVNVARWCRGGLMGQRGVMLIKQSEGWMRSQGIVHPGRYATAHVPCIDPE